MAFPEVPSKPKSARRPVFPGWMERLDPTLQGAADNYIYGAFRARRRGWSARVVPMLLDLRWAVALGLFFVALRTMATPAWGPVVLVFWCAVFLMVLDLPVFRDRLLRWRDGSSRMPRRMAGIFSPAGFKEHAAVDLWLAGVQGKDVLESIYYERREGNSASAGVGLGLLYLFCAVALFREPTQLIVRIPTALIMLAFFCELYRFWLVYQGYQVRLNYVDDQIKFWHGDDHGPEVLHRRFYTMLGIFLMLSVGVAEFHFVVQCYDAVVIDTLKDVLGNSVWRDAIIETSALQVLVVHFLIGAALLRWFRSVLIEAFQEGFKTALRSANADFERFMMATVVQDPDGPWHNEWAKRRRRGSQLPSDDMVPREALYFLSEESRKPRVRTARG